MNREQAKALVPILVAYGAGKTIQYKRRYVMNAPWESREIYNFNPDNYDYRIQPEPVRLFAIVGANNVVTGAFVTEATAASSRAFYGGQVVECVGVVK